VFAGGGCRHSLTATNPQKHASGLKPLLEQLPKKIQTLARVERTHKTFPVDVDYVGFSVSTTTDEHILVEVEKGEVTGAWMD
jgi:pyrimidine operon attenuation protein/uracil phosphoribosyltransferase